jgi:spore germination protein GerM
MRKSFKIGLYVVSAIAVLLFALLAILDGSDSKEVSAFEWQKQINVYFSNGGMGSDEDCSKVFPVSRMVLNAETLGPGALQALLEGVSPREKESGYSTALNDNILVQKFEVKDKTAYVDFNSRFSENLGGSCRVAAIKSQIENTLQTLPDIDLVVISVDGKTQGVLEP